jgi:hypothetical protein
MPPVSVQRMRSSLDGWDLAFTDEIYSRRMRSILVVRASDCQCTNGPGFDPSIRRHSGIWDEAVLNIVRKKREKIPPKNIWKKSVKPCSSFALFSKWKEGMLNADLDQGGSRQTARCRRALRRQRALRRASSPTSHAPWRRYTSRHVTSSSMASSIEHNYTFGKGTANLTMGCQKTPIKHQWYSILIVNRLDAIILSHFPPFFQLKLSKKGLIWPKIIFLSKLLLGPDNADFWSSEKSDTLKELEAKVFYAWMDVWNSGYFTHMMFVTF